MSNPEHYDVKCARCGVTVSTEWAFIEEGDAWECPRCWHRCEEKELRDEIKRLRTERDRLQLALERIVILAKYAMPSVAWDIARSALRPEPVSGDRERGAGQTAIPATAVPGLTSGEPGAAQGITGQSHKMCLHPKACRAGPDGYCGECHQACYP